MADSISNRGRKPKYDKTFPERGKIMARSGMFDEDIAAALGIPIRSYYRYQEKYPEFRQAIKTGKDYSDSGIEDNLYRSAKGFEITETKVVVDEVEIENKKKQRRTHKEKVVKEFAPNVTAAIFILCNRHPERWKNLQNVQHSGTIKMENTWADKAKRAKERLEARKTAANQNQ